MSISRKTPVGGYDGQDESGPRAISEVPISDIGRTQHPWPISSDVAPVRTVRRSTQPPTVTALGQEELLRLAGELPIDEGVEAVVRAVCEVLRDVVAPSAVGVVLREEHGHPARMILALSNEARETEVHTSHDDGGPPRRMFPQLADEWIVTLPSPFVGSSLHLGDATPPGEYGETPRDPFRARALCDVAERAALVLTSGVRAARRVDQTRVDGGQLRALQTRIIQSEKLASVGQIAAKVVHELNNPLTAIVTYSAFLTKKLERAGHEEADVERLRRIGESADRILRFSRELTTYARPNEETPGIVAIHEVVERAVVFCEHIVAEHGIQVLTRYDSQTPSIWARRGQLTQVFVNLVTNACHAIQDAGRREDGVIEIEISAGDDGGARVSIGDNGNGISPEHVVRIFDPFFTTKAEGRGTGLGLSIVRSIIEAHGGRVWVRSVLGGGASFIVDLRSGR